MYFKYYCLIYFSIAMKRYHDQNNLQKKCLFDPHSFRGFEIRTIITGAYITNRPGISVMAEIFHFEIHLAGKERLLGNTMGF